MLFAACSPSPSVDPDAGTHDAGDLDAGEVDAGPIPDAGVVVDAGPFLLAPGEVGEAVLTAGEGLVWLATPEGNEKFIAILVSTQFDGGTASTDYQVSLDAPPSPGRFSLTTGCSITPEPWASKPIPVEDAPTGTGVAVGTVRTLNVHVGSGAEAITAEAVAVGSRAVVWADVTAAHPANLDAGFVTQFLADFENTIVPRTRDIFGMETDVDQDGRIGLVFSPLTYQSAVAFFTQCDLAASSGCPPSNSGEYLYLSPPNTIPPPYNTPNAIKETLSHETAHLVHFGRKALRNQLTEWNESSYMIEGFGAFAQDAVGPQAGNLHVAKAGLDDIDQFSLVMLLQNQINYDDERDGLLRGGSYWFVRFLYDRAGGDTQASDGTITGKGGPAFIHALLEDSRAIADALPELTARSHADIATDFFTTLAMSNRAKQGDAAAVNPCFEFLPTSTDPFWNRQRGADVYAEFTFQMNGPATKAASAADGKLQPGGVECLTFDASDAGAGVVFWVATDPNAKARLRIARIR
jgi:hypothetical protein